MAGGTLTGRLIRECFKELLDDGEPHSLRDIHAYVNCQARSKGITDEIRISAVNNAIYQEAHKIGSSYKNVYHGYYQKDGDAANVLLKFISSPGVGTGPEAGPGAPDARQEFDWQAVLRKAVELQELLEHGFTSDKPIPDMSLAEIRQYRIIAEKALQAMESVTENLAGLMTLMDEHENTITRSQTMSM